MIGFLLFTLLQVFAVHPAAPAEGRTFTMREAVMGIAPKTKIWHWNVDGSLAEGPAQWKTGRKWKRPSEDREGVVIGESVSRNEFGINGGVFPSPGGTYVAFYRKDESAVGEFPLLDISTRTGSLVKLRYPMNGMASEHISLIVCDSLGRTVSTIVPSEFTDERYLTCVSWSPDDRYIFVQVLDRSQHHCVLNQYRASDGSYVRTILREDNDAWVEPQDPLHFLKGRYEFIYRSDNRDGYKNLYLCDTLGHIRRLTAVDADVQYAGDDGRFVYYTSAEVSPIENHLFRIDLGKKFKSVPKAKFGKPQRLTPDEGWHSISLSPDCSRFLDYWSSLNVPFKAAVRSTDGKQSEELYSAPDPLAGYAVCETEIGRVPSADGSFDNYYRLVKPAGFDPSKKYPVLVYVYGGPHSQLVQNRWMGGGNLWMMLMAQRGYVVYVQDNRGTSNRGAAFEKAINRECGQAEMADQVAGLRRLMEQPWVDRNRIGVHGWSYGGFMTISLMTNYPDIFKVGVAGGPVIDWKWYEVMYGERYMDTPETNPGGFAKTSLIGKAAGLKGKLLICQGAIDDTVLWEHSLSFVQECIERGVQLDYFPYPKTKHNVARGPWRVHLMDKVSDYFDLHL